MPDKLIFIVTIITLILFVLNVFYNGINLQTGLLFVLWFLPLMNLKVSNEAWGGFVVFDVIVFYCILFFVEDFLKVYKESNNILFISFILLTISILLSILASEFTDGLIIKIIKVIPIFIFSRFIILECIRDNSFYDKVIFALKGSVAISLIFLFIQVFVGLSFTFYPELNGNTLDPVYKIPRYPGVFYDSQASGQFLLVGSFLFLYNKTETPRKLLLLNYAFFFLSILGIYFAGSRSALGGFGLGCILLVLISGRATRLYFGAAVFFGCICIFFVKPDSGLFQRTESLSEDYLFRQSIWEEAIEIAFKNPIVGIGLGNYQQYVIKYAPNQYLEVSPGEFLYFDQPENGYLKILVEIGFVGFFVFLVIMIFPLLRATGFYLSGKVDRKIFIFIASVLGWLLAFNTVYSIYDARILIIVTCTIVLIYSYPKTIFAKS